MKRLWFVSSSYIRYLIKAKSRYVIHSPFIYDLINNVFLDNTNSDDLKKLDKTRKQVFNRTTTIETTDLGAAAGKKPYVTIIKPLGKIAKRRSQDKKHLHLLYKLTKYFKPASILEFGTSAGISASYIGKANSFDKFITMEGCAVLAAHAENNFNEQGLPDIEIKVGHFDVILDKVLDEFKQLDLVFIDGNHRKKQTIKYFEKCLTKSHEDSIFIFDDIHWSPGMEEAWEYMIKDERVNLSVDLFKMGLLFFKKGIAKQDFIIKY